MNTPTTLVELLGTMAEFKPFVAYNKTDDTLTVLLRDCSICEEELSPELMALRANQPPNDLVGFVLQRASRLFHSVNS